MFSSARYSVVSVYLFIHLNSSCWEFVVAIPVVDGMLWKLINLNGGRFRIENAKCKTVKPLWWLYAFPKPFFINLLSCFFLLPNHRKMIHTKRSGRYKRIKMKICWTKIVMKNVSLNCSQRLPICFEKRNFYFALNSWSGRK